MVLSANDFHKVGFDHHAFCQDLRRDGKVSRPELNLQAKSAVFSLIIKNKAERTLTSGVSRRLLMCCPLLIRKLLDGQRDV